MPRPLPRLDLAFAANAAASLGLVQRIEAARVAGHQGDQNRITLTDVELAYELAYLRVFTAWEALLEDVFLRLMCGYTRGGVAEAMVGGAAPYRTLALAEAAMLHGQQYVLWHKPARVIQRAQTTLANSNFQQVIQSAQARLGQLAAIRHRIAHEQHDASVQFNTVSMAIAGKRYKASRPGRFLRDVSNNPPDRWIDTLAAELESLAAQLCT